MKRATVIGMLIVAAACADPTTRLQSRPTDSLTVSPPPSGRGQTLTEEDAGTTVTLKVGESIRVSLPADYRKPDATGDALARTEAAGGYPTGSPATATFTAVRTGSVEITSTTDYACLHATPSCALPQQLWSVRVQVV